MTTITVDTYPEQEKYFASLCAAMKAQHEKYARDHYVAAYRSERNRHSIGKPTYWLDTGVAHIDCYLGAAMDSLAMAMSTPESDLCDDREYWRGLVRRSISRFGSPALRDIAVKEIKDHYRSVSRYSAVFGA